MVEAEDTNVPFVGTLDIPGVCGGVCESSGLDRVRCPRTSFPEIFLWDRLENQQDRQAFCRSNRQAGARAKELLTPPTPTLRLSPLAPPPSNLTSLSPAQYSTVSFEPRVQRHTATFMRSSQPL